MKIGVDIDGVLTDLDKFSVDYFCKFCYENNIDYKIGEPDYSLAVSFSTSMEQEDLFWDKYLEFYATNEKARTFASEVIKKLREAGHEIYILTARWTTNRDDSVGEHMRELVKNWLSENDIVYDKLIFSKASKERKSQEILDYKIDLMIEDSPNNILELSKIVPVICYDASYNRNCSGKNIYRCFSWYDIYNKIINKSIKQ